MKPTRVCATALVTALPIIIIGCSDQVWTPTEVSDVPSLRHSALPNQGSARNFVAPLAGSQEIPAVTTRGTGVAKFQLSADGETLSYWLIVANIENVTQAHIHLAPSDANGPVVAFLFGFVAGGVTQNGILAEGSITAADLIGPLAGRPLTELLGPAQQGDAYVNVHTVAHPSGEIRGQIVRPDPPGL